MFGFSVEEEARDSLTQCVVTWPFPSELTLYGLLAWREGDSLTYHGADQRRTQPFTFAQAAPVSLPPDAVTVTLTAPDAAVSTESGTCECFVCRVGQSLMDAIFGRRWLFSQQRN